MSKQLPTLNNANYLAVAQKNGLSEDQFWSKTLQKMIAIEQSEFVFTRLARKESIPKNYGTTTWSTRRYLHLPVNLDKGKLNEGIAPEPMTVEGKMVSGTIDQYGAYIEITDWTQDIHFDDIFNIYQPELARHAAETIERALISEIEAEASVAFAGEKASIGTVSASDVVTFEDLRAAWLTMRNHYRKGHPSAGGKPIFVAHPNVIQDLMDDENVVKDLIIVPGYDEKIIKSGTIAQYTIHGIYLMETSVLSPVNDGADGANVYRSYLIGGDSYVLLTLGSHDVKWFKKGFSADSADPLGQKSTVGYRLWTGGKVIDPMAIKVIYSGSGFDFASANFAIDEEARPATQHFDKDDRTVRLYNAPTTEYKIDKGADTSYAEEFANMIVVTATDAWGQEVVLTYTSGTPTEYEYTATGFDVSDSGEKTVTITHTIESQAKTATFKYEVVGE